MSNSGRSNPVSRFELPDEGITAPLKVGIGEVALWPLRHILDQRGNLVPVEFERELPFVPRRQFFVHNVGDDRIRGEHAHKTCHQFLLAVVGSLAVIVDDGTDAREIVLEDASFGLYLPPYVWGIQHKFKPYTVLSVYASHPYDAAEYMRSYSEFLAEAKSRRR